MPRGDRTGPVGMGSMTGHAVGYCAGYPAPGFVANAWGRGFHGGAGGGFWCRSAGRRHRNLYYATGMTGWDRTVTGMPIYGPSGSGSFTTAVTKEQKLGVLKKQAEYFEQSLEDLKNQIQKLESSHKDSQTT